MKAVRHEYFCSGTELRTVSYNADRFSFQNKSVSWKLIVALTFFLFPICGSKSCQSLVTLIFRRIKFNQHIIYRQSTNAIDKNESWYLFLFYSGNCSTFLSANPGSVFLFQLEEMNGHFSRSRTPRSGSSVKSSSIRTWHCSYSRKHRKVFCYGLCPKVTQFEATTARKLVLSSLLRTC